MHEDTLSIPARTVNKKQCMFAYIPCQGIACNLLQKADEMRIASRGLVKESQPKLGFGTYAGRHSRLLRDVVIGVRRSQLASPQVYYAARCAVQERVGVPYLSSHGELLVGLSC